MENSYNNKDFEQFIKQNADQYRMFPSEKVWEGINNSLHTRRRWYGIGLIFLLLTSGIVTWVMLLSPLGKKQQLAGNKIKIAEKNSIEQKNKPAEIIILASPKIPNSKSSPSRSGSLSNNLFLINVTPPSNYDNSLLSTEGIKDINPVVTIANKQPETNSPLALASVQPKEIIHYQVLTEVAASSLSHPISNSNLSMELDNKKEISAINNNTVIKEKDVNPVANVENVVTSYHLVSKRKKITWQIYFLPTISYRRLEENKSFLLANQQISGNSPLSSVVVNDVNSVVTHKPDIGLELGFNMGYPIGRHLKLTGGLQLNVSKYDIKAYPYPVEQARIALSNNNGSASVATIETNYRNFRAYTRPDWLSNFYISASLPVGLELNVTDTRKTYLGIGGTVQPTYILGDRAYLISTDFKNYAKVPSSLTRGWNVSTSFEIFAGNTTGKIKWKVGPQVRYQLLSSFDKRYPVKEHLIDFGLKVGIMLQ